MRFGRTIVSPSLLVRESSVVSFNKDSDNHVKFSSGANEILGKNFNLANAWKIGNKNSRMNTNE